MRTRELHKKGYKKITTQRHLMRNFWLLRTLNSLLRIFFNHKTHKCWAIHLKFFVLKIIILLLYLANVKYYGKKMCTQSYPRYHIFMFSTLLTIYVYVIHQKQYANLSLDKHGKICGSCSITHTGTIFVEILYIKIN